MRFSKRAFIGALNAHITKIVSSGLGRDNDDDYGLSTFNWKSFGRFSSIYLPYYTMREMVPLAAQENSLEMYADQMGHTN